MKKRNLILTSLLFTAMLSTYAYAQTEYPLTLTDDLGNEVTLEAAPTSIVSLSPSNTEILFAVGGKDLIVGRTDYCNYPAEAADIDSIGSYSEPNMELIISKTPQLVLASDYIDDAIRSQLEDTGAAVFVTQANDPEAIKNDIMMVGELIDHTEDAQALVQDMDTTLAAVKETVAKVQSPKSAFVDLGSFYSAGPGSLLDHVLTDINTVNIAADSDNMWPQLSVETIIEKNPDIYISTWSSRDDVAATAGLSDLPCLTEENFINLKDHNDLADMVQRPGPRYAQGAMELAKLVYPDLFA